MGTRKILKYGNAYVFNTETIILDNLEDKINKCGQSFIDGFLLSFLETQENDFLDDNNNLPKDWYNTIFCEILEEEIVDNLEEKNKEIENIISRLKQYLDYGISIGMDKEMQKDFNISLKSLKKEKYKKPTIVGEHKFCPSCGSTKFENYCQKCGQKIWLND